MITRQRRLLAVSSMAIIAVLLLSGCAGSAEPAGRTVDAAGCIEKYEPGVDYFPDKVEAAHAQGWSVRYEDSYKVLTTTVEAAGGHAAAGSRSINSRYVLLRCGAPEPELTGALAGATVIEVPVRTVADGGSVLYAALERLDRAEALVGEAERFVGEVETEYLPKIAARVASGSVAELGYDVNLEALAEADPDFYTNYAGDEAMFSKITELGIPVVYYFPYTESPLGAAEQLKFLALFFNDEARANEQFAAIESRYQELKQRLIASIGSAVPPKVLVGVVGSDAVTTNQNQRFEQQLIMEAGGVPVPDLPGGGKATVSMESFLDAGAEADYWLDLVFFPKHDTSAEYAAADPRLASLRPVKEGRLFHRIGKRGQDYFLSGAIDADLMLADLASIIHPGSLPEHELEFLGRVGS